MVQILGTVQIYLHVNDYLKKERKIKENFEKEEKEKEKECITTQIIWFYSTLTPY